MNCICGNSMLAVAKTIDFPVNHVCNHAKRREFVLYTCQVGGAVHINYTIVKSVADRAAVTIVRCVIVNIHKNRKLNLKSVTVSIIITIMLCLAFTMPK